MTRERIPEAFSDFSLGTVSVDVRKLTQNKSFVPPKEGYSGTA